MTKKTGFAKLIQDAERFSKKVDAFQKTISQQPKPTQQTLVSPAASLSKKSLKNEKSTLDLPRPIEDYEAFEVRPSFNPHLGVVGESFYEITARAVLAQEPLNELGYYQMLMVPEPNNPYDKTAVAVVVFQDTGLHKMGYLPKQIADKYFKVLKPELEKNRLAVVWGRASHVDDPDMHLGIWLAVEEPELLLPPLTKYNEQLLLGPQQKRLAKPKNHALALGNEWAQAVPEGAAVQGHSFRRTLAKVNLEPIASGVHRGDLQLVFYSRNTGERLGELTADASRGYLAAIQEIKSEGLYPCVEIVLSDDTEGIGGFVQMPKIPSS